MNILFLSQLLPYPLDSGAKVKTYHTLRLLSERHRVTLLTFLRNERERDFLPHLEGMCEQVKTCPLPRSRGRDARSLLGALASGRSFLVERDFTPAMEALVQEYLGREEIDVVHADRLQMTQYVRHCNGARRVLDQHNVESEIVQHLAARAAGIRKFLLRQEYRNLRRVEAQSCARFQHVMCVSERDRQGLERLLREECARSASGQPDGAAGRPRMHVTPIGVDCTEIKPPGAPKEEGRLLFVGPLNWPPNAEAVMWFVKEVWPQIQRRRPQAKFRVVGANAPRAVRQMARAPGIELAGYVEDLLPELGRATAMVVPLQAGSGLRVKILTAMAAGLAVVSTSVGYAGIEAVPGEHLLVADRAEEFAQAVISLLDNRARRRGLEQAGRQLVETRYDWPVVGRKLQEVYEGIEKTAR